MSTYPFKKTNKSTFQKPTTVVTEDALYWKKLSSPVLIKEFGAIDYLDFSPVEPYYFAATCSVRVQVYNPVTKVVAKNLSRFKKEAYGANFRSDGRLLVSGGEENVVRLFDTQSKNLLRIFHGHTQPVHRTFFTKDQTKVLSFSDDKTVSVWDLASEQRLTTFSEHNDYIRCGCASPISSEILLSGGYDNMIKLYDTRSGETILTVNHESPVETALFLPSGGIFISGGGTEIKVWDIFNGGKLLANISQHHKTVTCLRLASNNSRLLSSSLDRHVKIYDISTFQVVHNIDFPSAILSLAISNDDEKLVAGQVDGIISVRTREGALPPSTIKNKSHYKFTPDHVPDSVDLVQDTQVLKKRPKFEHYLQGSRFAKALDAVFAPGVAMKSPEITVSIIQELVRRDVLHAALAGRSEESIERILRFIIKNIGVVRFTRILIDFTNAFMDVYSEKICIFPEKTFALLKYLQTQIMEEIKLCKQLCEVDGAITLLMASSQIANEEIVKIPQSLFAPSLKAQKAFVIDI